MYHHDVKKIIGIARYNATQKILRTLIEKAMNIINSNVSDIQMFESQLLEYPPIVSEPMSRAAILDFIKNNIDIIYLLANTIRNNENIRKSIADYFSKVPYANLMVIDQDAISNDYTFSKHFLSNICYLFENTDLAIIEDFLKGNVYDHTDRNTKIDMLPDNDSFIDWIYSMNMQHLTHLTVYTNRYQFDNAINDIYEVDPYTMTIDYNPTFHKGISFDTIENKYHLISISKPYIIYAYKHLNLIYDSMLQFKVA